jgi:hypothetical protein
MRSAGTVRFKSFETFATGVRAFECAFRLRRSAAVHSRRFLLFFAVRFNLLLWFVSGAALVAIAARTYNLHPRKFEQC